MNRKGKCYTKEELELIKQLYEKGYSASLILEKIGRPSPYYYAANSWLFLMRRRLKLPKRGVGFRGVRRDASNSEQKRQEKMKRVKQRISKITDMLSNLEKHKIKLEHEKEILAKEIRECLDKEAIFA